VAERESAEFVLGRVLERMGLEFRVERRVDDVVVQA